MLVLTRRVGESVVIDHDIRITVVSVRGERVRLGITAPKLVQVDREEIHQRRAGANALTDRLELEAEVGMAKVGTALDGFE